MGYQIIEQPDGRLCVWSTVVDDLIIQDATPEELIDYYVEQAAAEARERASEHIDAVLAGEPERVYHQFAMTYEEALELSASTSR